MRPLDAAVGTELATRLLDATEPLQRNVIVAAAVAAVRAARLSRPLLEDSVDELVRRRHGGAARDELERLVQELDERAWAIQSTGAGDGADRPEYLAAVRKARAARAVQLALGTDVSTAMAETVFEAAHAVDSRDRLGQLLRATLELIEPGNHRAAQDLAGLFWPRFVEVDGYVLVADHFEPDSFAELRDRRPDCRWAVEDMINRVHVLEVAGRHAPPEAVGRACRHIIRAWREVLDATLPGCDVTVDWDPQERIVTAFSHA